ncbi:MAG: hypothetical protein OEY50_09710 [Nitrospinota bacterium]|nr:hypothetical protein [Nitrospinota bacterium]
MQYYRIIFAALLAFSLLAAPAMAEKITVKSDEISAALEMRKNMGGYIRLSGILTDILRNLKTGYANNPAAADTAVAQEAEDLLNEAGLAVSQDDYEESFAILKKATDLILGAIDRYNSRI